MMEINGRKLCINCMSKLLEDGTCPNCHYVQEEYSPKHRFLPSGTALDERYILGKVIGEGNFGITYIGWDSLLESRVAIKEFFPVSRVSRNAETSGEKVYVFETRDYEQSLHKYLDEGRRLSKLNQVEGIVSIRDFVHANNTAYIIMDYIEGISLKEYIDTNGPLPIERALDMLSPVMSALQKVHENGIIHRDISPDNIMVTQEKKLVLVDFGSARQMEILDQKSRTVQIKDGFSSPELYTSHGNQGPWSDVYSICATVYYMLVGKLPDGAVLRLLKDEMPSLLKMPELAGKYQLKEIIMKGMSLRPEDRYPSVGELQKALRKAGKSGKHPKGLWKWLGVAGCLLVVLGLGWWYIRGTGKEEKSIELLSSESKDTLKPEPSEVPTEVTTTLLPQENVQVIVPNVKKLSYQKAKKTLQKAGLKSEVTWVENKKKRGLVVGQNIEAGIACEAGTTILIRVSKGKSETPAPQIRERDSFETSAAAQKTDEKQYDGVIE